MHYKPLGELTNNFDGLRRPVREIDRTPGPYPYYGASGIVDYVDSYLFDGEYLLIAEDGENLRTRQTPVAFLANGKFWVNNHAHIVQGNEYADTRYLLYALQQADISTYLTGSTMPKLTQANLNQIPIPYMDLPQQQAIARTLGALDDKIELNRRMGQTLEEIARALFKSWFVEFDPVHAKAAGREPVGMDAETAALFPSEFEESELGLIPKGWSVGRLPSIASEQRELANPRHLDPSTPFVGLEHLPRKCVALDHWSEARRVSSQKACFLKGDVLFGKLRPYFHKVSLALVNGVCSTDIIVIRPTKPEWLTFVLLLVSSEEFVSAANAATTGTRMPRTNWARLSEFGFAMPPVDIAIAFDKLVHSMFLRIASGISQNLLLANLRETLLPKLLSGRVLVRDPHN